MDIDILSIDKKIREIWNKSQENIENLEIKIKEF